MSSIALVSDSTAGLSEEFVQRHGIRIVPLYLKIGEGVYRDGVDIGPDEFYRRLPQADSLPTTSQPSVGDFARVYGELAEQGATHIISMHLSAEISGTINSANLAAQQVPGVQVEIIDTRAAAGAHQLTVEVAAQQIQAGASFEDVVAAARRVVEEQRIVFTVDTLEYLYKGGRIGGAAALLGSLLKFKPLLYFSEGRIDALERVRTSNRALTRMAEVMAEWLGSEEPLQAIVMDAAATDRANTLAKMLPNYINVVNVRVAAVPPVLGAHGGPGMVGLCCCPVSVCGTGKEDE
ncbi:MAG TPA: DegV family protein [Chloroflexi bacterium]|jgi:DegV family protein with EDD domain|nr:DegV family protein [Chloroflexota bacterium]